MAAPAQSLPFLVQESGVLLGEPRTDPVRILFAGGESSMPTTLSLQSAGYSVHSALTGVEALRGFQMSRPDLILLTLRLPDMDGIHLLSTFREWTTAPIIVMSVQREESEQIACLDHGADDFLTKPFTMAELQARIRAALRRAFGVPRGEVFQAGGLKLDFSKRTVFMNGARVRLTASEYDLLKVLASHAGLVRTHWQLIRELWGGAQYQDSMHLLRVTMSNLRRKLGSGSTPLPLIVTEPGVGYRLHRHSDWSETPQVAAKSRYS